MNSMLCRAGVFTALAVVLSFSSASALSKQGAGIVYDAEYTKLQEQHGEVWAAEDAAIQERLDAMRAKIGSTPLARQASMSSPVLGMTVSVRRWN